MARGEGTVLIERSPEEVWEYIADLTHALEYIPGLTDIEVSLGPIGPGTRVTEVRRGGRLRGVLEVVEWDPPKRLRLRSDQMPLQADRLYKLEPAPLGTLVHYSTEVRGTGRAKVVELFIRRALRRDTNALLQTLKRQIEVYW